MMDDATINDTPFSRSGNGEDISLILFDLDGTLADTAPDIAVAINTLRLEEQRAPLPYASLRALVSRGANALLHFAFGTQPGDADHERLKQRFLSLYAENLCHDTQLFPGTDDVLRALEANGYRWGIVTNKPGALARPLLDQMGLRQRMSALVTGDCLPRRKPHPEPLLEACQLAGCAPGNTVYVGDAQCDMQAANAANIPGLLVRYGYIGDDDEPDTWQATAVLEQPQDLLIWLEQQDKRQVV